MKSVSIEEQTTKIEQLFDKWLTISAVCGTISLELYVDFMVTSEAGMMRSCAIQVSSVYSFSRVK